MVLDGTQRTEDKQPEYQRSFSGKSAENAGVAKREFRCVPTTMKSCVFDCMARSGRLECVETFTPRSVGFEAIVKRQKVAEKKTRYSEQRVQRIFNDTRAHVRNDSCRYSADDN